jgi:hypothetical protein
VESINNQDKPLPVANSWEVESGILWDGFMSDIKARLPKREIPDPVTDNIASYTQLLARGLDYAGLFAVLFNMSSVTNARIGALQSLVRLSSLLSNAIFHAPSGGNNARIRKKQSSASL